MLVFALKREDKNVFISFINSSFKIKRFTHTADESQRDSRDKLLKCARADAYILTGFY